MAENKHLLHMVFGMFGPRTPWSPGDSQDHPVLCLHDRQNIFYALDWDFTTEFTVASGLRHVQRKERPEVDQQSWALPLALLPFALRIACFE